MILFIKTMDVHMIEPLIRVKNVLEEYLVDMKKKNISNVFLREKANYCI